MFARLAASLFLLSVGATASSSGETFGGRDEIVVYLRQQEDLQPDVSDAMWQETNSLLRQAGYRVRRLNSPHQVHAAFLVVVELEGRCVSGSSRGHSGGTLASAEIEDGRILPFIKVKCKAVHQFLAFALGSRLDAQFLYGRALGRVLAHELYHVAAQTTEHTRIGVTQAAVSASELLSEQFTLCDDAVDRLRSSSSYSYRDSARGR